MTWQELPAWCKIRMIIDQKLQKGYINISMFKDNIQGGFLWDRSFEGRDSWSDILMAKEYTFTPQDPWDSKLKITKPTPTIYELQMSHSEIKIRINEINFSDLGISNPIIDEEYHTFEEHLNNSLQETNPECLAFKEWAENNRYWEKFVADYSDLFIKAFTITDWIKNCNKYKRTGFDIIAMHIPSIEEKYWKTVWEQYTKSKEKSPAEIFIEWAFTQPHNTKALPSLGHWYLEGLRLVFGRIISKEDFIKSYKNSPLDTICRDIFNTLGMAGCWRKEIEENWQNYLKTINYENQLQREEIPVSRSTGESRLGIHLGGDIIEPSRGYRSNQKGCEIFGEEISISKAGLSFGHNCSL